MPWPPIDPPSPPVRIRDLVIVLLAGVIAAVLLVVSVVEIVG